jgi:hypothetical protein
VDSFVESIIDMTFDEATDLAITLLGGGAPEYTQLAPGRSWHNVD